MGPGFEQDKRILIVDDDPNTCWNLSSYLGARGFDCAWSTDGEEALELIVSHDPSVVILDLVMPGLSGLELAKRIDATGRKPKIILISGHIDAVAEANKSGIEVFRMLWKPIPLRQLRDFLTSVLESDTPPGPRPPARSRAVDDQPSEWR